MDEVRRAALSRPTFLMDNNESRKADLVEVMLGLACASCYSAVARKRSACSLLDGLLEVRHGITCFRWQVRCQLYPVSQFKILKYGQFHTSAAVWGKNTLQLARRFSVVHFGHSYIHCTFTMPGTILLPPTMLHLHINCYAPKKYKHLHLLVLRIYITNKKTKKSRGDKTHIAAFPPGANKTPLRLWRNLAAIISTASYRIPPLWPTAPFALSTAPITALWATPAAGESGVHTRTSYPSL